jgi:hypothetical protein
MTQTACLIGFRKDYPMVTIGELQSFTLGMQAREPIILELKNLINEIKTTLNSRNDDSMVSWINEQIKYITF